MNDEEKNASASLFALRSHRKHDSAMQCANPQCSKELLYLREGTLNLLEMEPHSDDQFQSDVGAFAMRSVPSKYFWLCGQCTKTLIVKRWTTAGIVLVLRNQKTAGSLPNLAAPPATSATTAAIFGATDGFVLAAEGAPAPSARFAGVCWDRRVRAIHT